MSQMGLSQMSLMIWLLLVAEFLSTTLNEVHGLSTGPPASTNFDLVCNQMAPNPSPGIHGSPSSGNGGYFIDISPPMSEVADGFTYVGGQVYTSKFFYHLRYALSSVLFLESSQSCNGLFHFISIHPLWVSTFEIFALRHN